MSSLFRALSSLFKRALIAILSPYLFAKYGDWWIIREEGLSRLHTRRGRLLTLAFEREVARQGGWIGRGARFAGQPCFPHGMRGIFISDEAQVGRGCVLFQHTMIVSNQLLDSARRGAPTIGDHVFFGCGAVVIGAVKVGEGCRLGTNVVVHHDLAPHSVAVCQPARIIERDQPMDNRHVSLDAQGAPRYWEEGRWVKASTAD